MDKVLKKALKCILESCGLVALHKINDNYIEVDKTKLCKQEWVKDVDLFGEDDDYVRMFVHQYRENIDVFTEYDEGVAPEMNTVMQQLAFLGDVEKLVVKRHQVLLLDAAERQQAAQPINEDVPNFIDNMPTYPTEPFSCPSMPDVDLPDLDKELSDLPESTSTTISINNEDTNESGFNVKED